MRTFPSLKPLPVQNGSSLSVRLIFKLHDTFLSACLKRSTLNYFELYLAKYFGIIHITVSFTGLPNYLASLKFWTDQRAFLTNRRPVCSAKLDTLINARQCERDLYILALPLPLIPIFMLSMWQLKSISKSFQTKYFGIKTNLKRYLTLMIYLCYGWTLSGPLTYFFFVDSVIISRENMKELITRFLIQWNRMSGAVLI